MTVSEQLKIFGMQNFLMESELTKLEDSGIEINHKKTLKKDELVDVELFDRDILNEAKKMADFYVLYFSLENTVRRLISEKLFEEYGPNWWEEAVPEGIRNSVKDKQEKEKDTVLTIRSEDQLQYSNFGELIVVLENQWNFFADSIRSKKAMQQTLSQFNQIRNVIAHSCSLSENDIIRLKLLINDWLNLQT